MKTTILAVTTAILCLEQVYGLASAPIQQRRHFLQMSSSAILTFASPQLALATDEETEEEARIRRKLAAQEKDRGTKRTYTEDLKAEREREKALKSKSKKQQQEDLCELLGRGC